MKQPSLSRFRKKPTAKLNLVCSFNGEFHVRPPSNKLRFIGGETRIVSVDRNVSFSKLRLNISDICPNTRSFTLKYWLRLTGRSRKETEADDEMTLVLIASDDDVKCMVDEYDRLELYGKHARLWVFVCSETECVSNSRVEKGGNEDLLRKMVSKQRLLAKQTRRNYEHQFMDSHLGPQPKFSALQSDPNGEKIFLFNGRGNERLHPLNPRDGNLPVKTNCPMEFIVGRSSSGLCNGGGSKTGNTGQSSLPSKEVYDCGVVSMPNCFYGKHFTSNGLVLTSNFNRENIIPWTVNCGSVKTHLPSTSSNQHVGSIYPGKSSYFGDKGSGSCQNGIRSHRFGVYGPRNHRIYPYCVRNHRNNFVEAENHRGARLDSTVGTCYLGIKPYSNITEQRQSMGQNDPSLLKLWPGFAEHASEGRVSLTASCLNKAISPFDIQYGKANFREQGGHAILQFGNANTMEGHLAYHDFCNGVANQSFPSSDAVKIPSSCVRVMEPREDPLTGSEFEKNDSLYHTLNENFRGMSTNYASNCSDLETEKLLVGSLENANISGLSNEVDHRNGAATASNCSDLETEKLLVGSLENANISGLSNEMDHRNGAATGCNLTNGSKNFQDGIASSMDLLHNLSLASSKEIDTPQNSSVSGSVVSDALLKSQSKPLDPVDEGLFSAGPVVDESNRVRSISSSQNVAKARRVDVHGEEVQKDPGLWPEGKDAKVSYKSPKIIGPISSHLTAFFSHLSAGELQTIKNSDLEYIKELGSGTFGTVFYGKWRGSDVAIKRMKPSCFSRDSLEEDRLVADFWREAHMLGQLHHPNIVALYGVVTDGPATNLATVTEYMVNGSLKQVLQRKDRTIDRRKRLIIAMDAAFGMEYLHEKNIVHFDLKSHNFLVNMRNPQRPVCKIGDLGLSKIKQKTLISGGVRGTIPWMAPELLNNKNNLVTEKIDVYSFGVVMWELLTGEEPYANLHSVEIIAGIIKGSLRPEIPNWCDPSWRSLMERCWSSDADSRPAFSEISKELRAMAVSMNIK